MSASGLVADHTRRFKATRVQALQSLEQKKREAAQELNLLNQNLEERSSSASAVCVEDVIPADTEVSCEVTANCDALQLELSFVTNNRCVIKGVVIFAEGLFTGVKFTGSASVALRDVVVHNYISLVNNQTM